MPPKRKRSDDAMEVSEGPGTASPAADCSEMKKQKINAPEPTKDPIPEKPIEWNNPLNLRILQVFVAYQRGDVPLEVLQRLNVTNDDLRKKEEEFLEELDADKLWDRMKTKYKRNVFVKHPNWKTAHLRAWLNGEIKANAMSPMTPAIFEEVIKKLGKFFSRERDALRLSLVEFTKNAHDHKTKAKEDEEYLTTEQGKVWCLDAARHIIDPKSTAPDSINPTPELLSYVEPILKVIARTPNSKQPDFDQFKSRSIAKEYMGFEHSEKPVVPKPEKEKESKAGKNKNAKGKTASEKSAKGTNKKKRMIVSEDFVDDATVLSDSDGEEPIPMLSSNTNAKK